MTLPERAESYIELHRQLGYVYDSNALVIRSYTQYANEVGDTFLVSHRMIAWAGQSQSPWYAWKQLQILRGFAKWLHAEDVRHEIPPADALGTRTPLRRAPVLLSRAEITRLLDAALHLPPRGSISPFTYHYFFGLIAATGLRKAEAASLRLSDITPDGLLIRDTKFRKSRLVPVRPSVVAAIDRYRAIRRRAFALSDHLFVLSHGRPPVGVTISETFRKLVVSIGIKKSADGRYPTPHSLRHRFAVSSLEQALSADRDSVDRHVLALTTYLGHASVRSTYWYLEATPVLLQTIAEIAERTHQEVTTK